MKRLRAVGLTAFFPKREVESLLGTLLRDPEFSNVRFFAPPGAFPFSRPRIKRLPLHKFLRAVDAVVSFGGDGSLLSAARLVSGDGIPLIGINLGGLGFLTDVPVVKFRDDLREIFSGRYRVKKRMMFDIALHSGQGRNPGRELCLNDAVIKSDGPKLLHFSVQCGNSLVSTYNADGLILSTPTGSTAYSLAAGGPIVHPALDSIIITPICSHSLTQKPIVCPIDLPFRVTVEGDKVRATLSVDGKREFPFRPGDAVVVTRSRRVTTILTPLRATFFGTMREKLKWGKTQGRFS